MTICLINCFGCFTVTCYVLSSGYTWHLLEVTKHTLNHTGGRRRETSLVAIIFVDIPQFATHNSKLAATLAAQNPHACKLV